MTLSEVSILIGGFLSLCMALFHFGFPRLFLWERDLRDVSAANRLILKTIHLALLLLFLLFGVLSLYYFRELAACQGLAFGLTALYALFWLWRLVWQIACFRPSKKKLMLHAVLVAVFFLLFLAYALPVAGVS